MGQEATSADCDVEDTINWGCDPDDADGAEDILPPDVEMSNDFQQDVEKPVSASSDASWEQALLWQDARQEMLPSFLQPTAHSWTPESDAFRQMQAMKAREVEHVRWRVARPAVRDPELQCVEHAMRTAARRVIQTRHARRPLARLCQRPPGYLPQQDGLIKSACQGICSGHGPPRGR